MSDSVHCTEDVYRWLRDRGLHFLPVVHWVERGLYEPGNSVPRFHVVWSTRQELAMTLIDSFRTQMTTGVMKTTLSRFLTSEKTGLSGTSFGRRG